ncbi:MAG: glycosyltransferase [Pseudoxanthomonas sp.]
MSSGWPRPGLESFLSALPFEHLLRKRVPEEAFARWRAEAGAWADAEAPRIALLLDCAGDPQAAIDSAACWAAQTWAATAMVVLGEGAGDVLEWARGHGLKAKAAGVDGIAAALRDVTADWVVPACAGDLLHPSLAGVIAVSATRGADAVAWDWLSGRRSGRRLVIERRYRAPWRDDVAELVRDQRGRTFAVPAEVWSAYPPADAWRVRMMHGATAPHVHAEPLGIQPPGEAVHAQDLFLAARRWGRQFEAAAAWPRPAMAASGVSVVVLYRDRAELTLRAIESVLAQRFEGRLQLVLVDNQSSAETKATIRQRLQSLPHGVASTILAYDAPFNHSRQCNLGVAAASEEVVLFLNNDVELIDPDVLDALARWALLPGISTVGACVVDATGKPSGGGFRCRRMPGAEFNSPVEEAAGPLATRARVTVGNTFACAALARDTFVRLGGLDELTFPVGYNDADFCLRASRDGLRHVNLGQHRVTHAVGASRTRTDEIAQKLALRCAHPWTLVRALQEVDDEPATLPESHLPEPI